MEKKVIKLYPVFKDYLWGGTRLKTDYNMKSDLEKLAEAWVLSCHKDGESFDENGKTLSEMIAENPDWLGENGKCFDNFPILTKLIDAKDNLSIQVHPDNDYALRVEGEYGKTEMWYVVDCDEGAYLYYGFKEKVTKEQFKQGIENNTLTDMLNRVYVKKGDCFFIQSGTIHAIGAGLLIAEIQQNSNTTYRVYDYGRVGADGKPRQLHVEKALDVTVTDKAEYPVKNCSESGKLFDCEYFKTELIKLNGSANVVADETSFVSLLVTRGSGEINGTDFAAGESFFVPAGFGELKLCGNADIIVTRV